MKAKMKSGKMKWSTILLSSAVILVLSILPVAVASDPQVPRTITYSNLTYTSWTEKVNYESSTKYNARGMAPIYKIIGEVLKLFIGTEAIPKGYIEVSDTSIKVGPKVENNEWGELIKHYWAILLVVVLTLLLVVLMPIIGLCFCCCRCAGACGARTQPFDKKHDTCKRVFLGFLLICAATGILFGVIIAFATNAYMQEGIEESPDTLRHGSSDINLFLKSTGKEINHILVTNYHYLDSHIKKTLNETANNVVTELAKQSKAIKLDQVEQLATNLPHIRSDLVRMKIITNELRINASQLSDGLRGVKRDLLNMLTKCEHVDCKEILKKYNIGTLDANGFDYNKLPDLSGIIDDVDRLISDDITNVVKAGKNSLNEIKENLAMSLKSKQPEIEKIIETMQNMIKGVSENITEVFDRYALDVQGRSNYYSGVGEQYITQYGNYRFLFGVMVSSLLLMILVFITCALFCGICGKRPDGYGDDCCNKGSGSRFLMTAVAVIFLFTSALAVVALVHFLLGLVAHRGVCVPLKDPTNDDVFAYLDSYVDLNVFFNKNIQSYKNQNKKFSSGTVPAFRISHVISSCMENKTIYEVLRIENQIDVEDIKDSIENHNLKEKLDDFVNAFDIRDKIVILTEKDKEKLYELGNSSLVNFDNDKFKDNVRPEITNQSLSDLSNKLRETAKTIKGDSSLSDVRITLRNQALHLDTYQHNLVEPMTKQAQELLDLSTKLDKLLRKDGQSFQKNMQDIIKELEKAQDFINTEGKTFVERTLRGLVDHLKSQIQKYIDFIVDSIKNDVGKCGPIANVYKSTVVAVCSKFVDPLNGFWAGTAWCVLLFLPTIVICVKLSSLYQKSDPYPGPLVENGPKNKRRKQKDRRRGGSRERHRDYYEDQAPAHPAGAGSAGRDTRYNDMAPKHWDGGPPRYTNPPMAPPASEYERPPPYYYPGTSDQD